MIEVIELSKSYSDSSGTTVPVLAELSLSIEAGASAAIMGPSGSGKTTLLNILGTLDTPTSGSVKIGEQALEGMSPVERASFRNRSLGFIFQQHFLLPQCTVLENVLMPRLAGAWDEPAETTEARAASLLEELGLSARSHHLPSQLSGGERLRAAIARALINEPLLVLADEPTGSLDQASADSVAKLLGGLVASRGVTLLVVTHNADLAAQMNQTYHLNAGQLQ